MHCICEHLVTSSFTVSRYGSTSGISSEKHSCRGEVPDPFSAYPRQKAGLGVASWADLDPLVIAYAPPSRGLTDPNHTHHCTSLCLQGSVSLRNPLRFSDPQAELYFGV